MTVIDRDEIHRRKFHILPRNTPRKAAPESFLDYPGHPPDKSAKYCLRCGVKQRRSFVIRGPLDITECIDVPEKKPRITASPRWKKFGLAWLVSPPSYSLPDRWYVVTEEAQCPVCGECHKEKEYRRKFGLLKLSGINLLPSFLSSTELVSR